MWLLGAGQTMSQIICHKLYFIYNLKYLNHFHFLASHTSIIQKTPLPNKLNNYLLPFLPPKPAQWISQLSLLDFSKILCPPTIQIPIKLLMVGNEPEEKACSFRYSIPCQTPTNTPISPSSIVDLFVYSLQIQKQQKKTH